MLLQSGRAFGAEDRRFVKLALWNLALPRFFIEAALRFHPRRGMAENLNRLV